MVFLWVGGVVDDGEGKVVFESEEADDDDCGGTGKLLEHHRAAHGKKQPVDQCAGEAGRGVYVFFENQRLIIDQYVTDHSTESPGDDSHDCRHPHGVVDGEGFVDSYHAEESEPNAVENKKDAVSAHQDASEHNHSEQG